MNIQCKNWALIGVIMGLFLYSTAEALTVDTTNDSNTAADGECSLREAINAVNFPLITPPECISFPSAPAVINFMLPDPSTITLLSALPALGKPVTIAGPGTASLAVSGNNSFPVFQLEFNVGLVTISNLTIQDGGSSGIGGGSISVASGGALTLSDSVVTGSDEVGVYTLGTLTMERTLIYANAGGGLNFGLGSFGNITDSTISNNTLTGGFGAGIFNDGEIDVVNTTISKNTTDLSGGGISNDGLLRLVGSTVSSNSAQTGAGIFTQGDVIIINSTISTNSGTGIHVSAAANARLSIYSSTVTGNQGAGLDNNQIAAANNTIFAENTGDNCTGQAVTSFGYNIDDSIGDCGFNNMGDQIDVDPLLGPLQDNGGLTFTHALLTGSPAIDAGDPNGCTDPLGTTLDTDQRGEKRPIDGDGDIVAVCDIGAYEWASALSDLFGGGGGGGLCSLGPKSASAWMAGDLWLLLAFISGLGLWGTRRRKDAVK